MEEFSCADSSPRSRRLSISRLETIRSGAGGARRIIPATISAGSTACHQVFDIKNLE
jgi:hypothetical protein